MIDIQNTPAPPIESSRFRAKLLAGLIAGSLALSSCGFTRSESNNEVVAETTFENPISDFEIETAEETYPDQRVTEQTENLTNFLELSTTVEPIVISDDEPAETDEDSEIMLPDLVTEGIDPLLAGLKAEVLRMTDEELKRYRCEINETSIPAKITDKLLRKGLETDFALNNEQSVFYKTKIENSQSESEINSYISEVFSAFGKKAQFDPYSGSAAGPETIRHEMSLEEYKKSMTRIVTTLSRLPKEFVNTDNFKTIWLTKEELPSSNDEADIAGFFSESDEILAIEIFKSNSIEWIFTHELAHSAHTKACENYRDWLFKKEFESIIAELPSSTLNELGLPSEYSTKNAIELFAEYATSLIINGTLRTQDELARLPVGSRIARLQELTIGRIQTALPNTDVPAWLAINREFATELHGGMSAEEAFNRMNPFMPTDRTDDFIRAISAYDLIGTDGYYLNGETPVTRKPAIFIKSGDKAYPIDAHFTGDRGERITFVLNNNTKPDLKIRLESAMKNYVSNITRSSSTHNYQDIEPDILSFESISNNPETGYTVYLFKLDRQ